MTDFRMLLNPSWKPYGKSKKLLNKRWINHDFLK